VVTPNTSAPFATTPVTWGPPTHTQAGTASAPVGFQFYDCYLYGPTKVSHFDLFDRIPGAQWKGCVEARREPYDVTDAAAGSGDPDTLFVPYFWQDEPDTTRGDNNYMADFPAADIMDPLNFEPLSYMGAGDRNQTIFKYNGTNNGGAVALDETGPDTAGPNKACPDPIVPLTSNISALTSAIGSLTHKFGGGTINSEGIMWGWRVLSPGAPFTEGKPYGQAQKYMVLMSDGKNEINAADIDGNVFYSDYTAYGPLAQWESRLAMGRAGVNQGAPVRSFAEATTYLNDRMAQACQNAKAAGVTIITILFREENQAAKDLMSACATKPSYAYYAANTAALDSAFEQVAKLLQNLRLSK
jgi:hypothetical protein